MAQQGPPLADVSYGKDLTPAKLTMLQWRATHPCVYGQHKLDLVGYEKEGEGTWGWEGVGIICEKLGEELEVTDD